MNRININIVGKWMEFLNDFISVFISYLFTRAIFGLPFINSFTCFIYICINMIVLTMMGAYDDLCSYTTQKKRFPITAAVSLVISLASNIIIYFLIGKGDVLSPGGYAFLYFFAYAIIIFGRQIILNILLHFVKKQTLLIIFAKGYPDTFLNKLKKDAVDFGDVRFCELCEASVEKRVLEEIDKSDQVLLLSNVDDWLRDKYLLHAFEQGKTAKILPTVENLVMLGGAITHIGDTPVIGIKNNRLPFLDAVLKRSFDFIAALAGLVILSPVFLLCAAAIKIDSPGPVFYLQERYTIYKKRFNIIKFRTMVEDAESGGARLATENDSRITRFGAVLRACRLDELPQLINILKGEMSLVGPRPERPVYADEYSMMVKNYDIRYMMKAGLTGYAQIYGQYNTKVSDKVLFDSIYINNFSVWLDFKLILQTVMIMFVKESTEGVEENMAKVPDGREKDGAKSL